MFEKILEKHSFYLPILIGGVAGSGKNTLAAYIEKELHSKNVKFQEFSFAASLREELFEFVRDQFGIDVYTQDRKQKEIIRPILVGYARARRIESNGEYFSEILAKKLKKFYQENPNTIPIVTDLRFNSGENDEVQLFKKEFCAFCCHITLMEKEKVLLPANDEEEIHDPMVKSACDFKFTWQRAMREAKTDENSEKFLSAWGKVVVEQYLKYCLTGSCDSQFELNVSEV